MLQIVPNIDKLKGGEGEMIRSTKKAMLAVSTPESRAGELLTKLNDEGFDPYRLAYRAGMNVSTFLEHLDPSKDHKDSRRGVDAFDRLITASGLRMVTDMTRGLFASKLEDFHNCLATERLVPELIARFYREASQHTIEERQRASAVYLSSDYVTGSIMRPYENRQQVIRPVITTAIPLSALVAITTGITGDEYRGFYVDDDVDARRMKRVTEAAELPRTRIKGRQNAVRTYKYGRAIEMSYETLRRMQIDMLAIHLQMIAAQAEADKVLEVLNVLSLGDGNNNAITTVNLTTLDPATTANNLTVKAWMAFEMELEAPYAITTVIGQKGPILSVRLLNVGTANTLIANANILGLNNFTLINRTADNVQLGWTADAPANKLIGFDASRTIERVYEIGASISEVDRFITRQVEVLTLSEQEGYAILDPKGRRALNLAA